MAKFRFEDLEIWKETIDIAHILFGIANELEQKKLWRFADQVRGVGLSIPNNISESTGTYLLREQQQFLRYSKRECFEAANMTVLLLKEDLIKEGLKNNLFARLDIECRKIQSYSDSLAKNSLKH